MTTSTLDTPRDEADAPLADERRASPGRLRDHPWLVLLVIAAQLVVLQLVLRTPFLGDDGPNQVAVGYAKAQGQTLLQFIWHVTIDQYHGLGRFMLFGQGSFYLLNGLIHDRVIYKLILVALTVASTLALARTLVAVRIPAPVALLGAGLTAPLWQLHAYHDPLVSYAAVTQMMLIASCGATLCHLRWLRGGSAWWTVPSILLLVSATFFYQAGIFMGGMIVGATLAEGGRLRTLVPVLAATAAGLLFTAMHRPDAGPYAASFAPGPLATTFAKQLVAGLPGASWLDPLGAKIRAPTGTLMAWIRGVLVALLLLPVVRQALRARPIATEHGPWRPVGLLLLIGTPALLPAAVVALATRYQAEIRWGVGYLPLAPTVAGIASAGALLVWWASRRVSQRAVGFVTIAAIVVGVSASASASMRLVSADYGYAQTQDELRELAPAFAAIPTSTTFLFAQDNFTPPNGVWLPGYGYAMSNWLYVQAHRWWPAFPVPPGATGALCTNKSGDAIEPPCPRIAGDVMWVRTGRSYEQQRWLLLTPAARPAATDVLSALPASGSATVYYPSDRGRPTVEYVVDAAAPPVAVDPATLRRLPGNVGRWARYSVPVPQGAQSGTGSVR